MAVSPSSLSYRSILLTGGQGFVGGWLLPHLIDALSSEARLTIMGRGGQPATGRINHVTADLRDAAAVHAVVREVSPDLVLHLAAQSSVAQSASTAGDTWAINLGGSLALAQACAAIDFAGTFLFISSAEVYGLAFNTGVASEATALLPQSTYGRSKAAAEAMLADVLPRDARLIVARPGNHSGPGQDDRFVLPSFAKQIADIERGNVSPVLRVGNLEAERDFLDVRDVIDAYLALLAAAPNLPKRTIFNIASSRSQRIADLLQQLLALSDAPITVERDPDRLRPSDIARAALSNDAIRQATGWQPTRMTEAMLSDLLAEERRRTM